MLFLGDVLRIIFDDETYWLLVGNAGMDLQLQCLCIISHSFHSLIFYFRPASQASYALS